MEQEKGRKIEGKSSFESPFISATLVSTHTNDKD